MIHDAILILGPTGSGKTPLGEYLQRHSLWGRACHHFDFGDNLRSVAARKGANGFSDDQLLYIRKVLQEGALLEKETFHIAVKILETFVCKTNVEPNDLLVLNGLPRHAQQAEDLEGRIRVIAVVQLECDATTVLERLRRNTGRDRADRVDDDETLVARKLHIYHERTQPLMEHYRARQIPILKIAVTPEMDASQMAGVLMSENFQPQSRGAREAK